MFNMYLSGSWFRQELDNQEYSERICRGFCCVSSGRWCSVSRAEYSRSSFQSQSPSALLSEIGNPFSWTRFLARRRRDRHDNTLYAPDSGRAAIQLGFQSVLAFITFRFVYTFVTILNFFTILKEIDHSYMSFHPQNEFTKSRLITMRNNFNFYFYFIF